MNLKNCKYYSKSRTSKIKLKVFKSKIEKKPQQGNCQTQNLTPRNNVFPFDGSTVSRGTQQLFSLHTSKCCFRLSGVLLKLCKLFLSCTENFYLLGFSKGT